MADTERTVAKTYVPRYQKEIWQREADDLGMSQSEFLRTMVQAGRSEMGLNGETEGTNPGGSGLESRIRALLREGPRDWEQLVAEFTTDLEATVESMQTEGELRYSQDEGYILEE